MLGCGDYRAFVLSRGGETNYGELAWDSLRLGRALDGVSDASVTVGADGLSDEDCCSVLGSLKSWKHELAIWRDDDTTELEPERDPEWVGPVLNPVFRPGGASVPARDLAQWLQRRSLTNDRSWSDEDLGVIFAQYVADALARDNAMGIVCEPTNTGVRGQRSVEGALRRRAMDELNELARSGVDYSAIGRTIVVGGAEVPTAPIPLLGTEDFLDDLEIAPQGLDAASEVTVLGSSGPDPTDPIVGTYGDGEASDIGLVEQVFTESSIEDNRSARIAARTRWQFLQDVPEIITGSLVPSAPITFAQLIPGARVGVRIRAGCREAVGVWRLASVECSAQVMPDGGIAEEVKVALIPLGTVSGDAESEARGSG